MKLKSIFTQHNIDSFLITNLTNVSYLTNFSGSNGQVLITKKNNFFLTDSRYMEQAKYEINKDFEIIIYKKLISSLEEIAKKLNLKKLGFESKHLTYFQFENIKANINIELVPLKDIIESLREKKEESELEKIKKAISIAEKSLKNIKHNILHKKISEKQLANILEEQLILNGAEDKAFPTIVLSNGRTSLIHGSPSNNLLDRKCNLLIDFGAKYKNYHSDKTVTLIFDNSNKDIKKIFNIVKDAKNYAIEKIKSGIEAKELDKIARDYIDKKGYGKFFLHSLGHGIGMEVHEKPVISSLSDDIIKENMVVTIEPGIYIEGFLGVRLEDMVFVGKDGANLLTTLSEETSKCLLEL